jgi:hypothetical protein
MEIEDLHVMLTPGDDAERMEITVFDDDQPVFEVSLIDLVAQWVSLESVEGELHPYLDGTLNVLSDMTYAIIKVIERLEADDPHRAALLEIYTLGYDYAQRVVDAVNGTEGGI